MEENTIDPSTTISEMGNTKRVRPLGSKRDEVHNIERERRKKITQMFTHLRTTVPSVFPKVIKIIHFLHTLIITVLFKYLIHLFFYLFSLMPILI